MQSTNGDIDLSYRFPKRIIEIIGPPGVGKTTIYEALCKSWNSDSSWIYQDALLAKKPDISELAKWIEFQLKKLLNRKLTKSIPVEYGLRFVESHKDLANFYWSYLSSDKVYPNNAIDKRFRSAYFLFSDFCRYQAILECTSNKVCIINEGLLQKSFFINQDKQFMADIIPMYISLLPVPHSLIYIDTPDKNVILDRLRGRSKVIASHLGKDDKVLISDIENWQSLMSLVIDKMVNKGVQVHPINGNNSVEENVSIIRGIFNQ